MGILNKKESWYTVPDKDPYRFDIDKAIVKVLIGIIAVGMIVAIASCNAYKGIEKKPPLSKADSLRLANRFGSTFPPKPPKVIQGKPIIKTVTNVDKKKLNQLQNTIDSLIDANEFQEGLINGTPNIDSLKKAIKIAVLKDCKTETDTIYSNTTDTVYYDTPETIAQKESAQRKVRVLEDLLIKSNTERDIYKKRSATFFWILIGLCVVGGVSLFFNFKKKLSPTKLSK